MSRRDSLRIITIGAVWCLALPVLAAPPAGKAAGDGADGTAPAAQKSPPDEGGTPAAAPAPADKRAKPTASPEKRAPARKRASPEKRAPARKRASPEKRAPATTRANPDRRAGDKRATPRPARSDRPVDPLKHAEALLASGDAAEVRKGLQQMVAIGKPACVAPVMDRLDRGLPPKLALRAVETLGLLGDARAYRALTPLLTHRRPALRASAARTLGLLNTRQAVPPLLARLDDPDAGVRAATVEALAGLGDRRAFDPLADALRGGQPGAAAALGTLSRPPDVARLSKLAGELSYAQLAPAFAILRDRSDFPLGARVSLVRELGKLDDPGAAEFLRDYLDHLPEQGRKPLMRAIGKSLEAIKKRADAAALQEAES